MSRSLSSQLVKIYETLFGFYGPQHWWPARSRFEVMLGAILTQNTNWKNVEKAIANLRQEGALVYETLQHLSLHKLAELIRPSGYFNIKADRIKSFCRFIRTEYQGNPRNMFKEETVDLRKKLLQVKGIGPETADSILLYAARRPIFVVDAYTRRILSRHGLCDENSSYEQIQDFFMENLPPDEKLFNEYHALLVQVGKSHCTPTPVCSECPLQNG